VKITAITHGSATLVNAIPCGRGAAFSLDLPLAVTVELTDIDAPLEITCETNPDLVHRCVSDTFARVECRAGARVEVISSVPVARGLSSSSAVSNAAVLAATVAAGADPDDSAVLDAAIDISIAMGVSVTGALDDAHASYFGGAVATDNLQRKMVTALELPSDAVAVVLIPPEPSPTAATDVEALRRLASRARNAWEITLKDPARGMTLNGRLVCEALNIDSSPMEEALNAGALGASLSGTGSAFVALARKEGAHQVVEAFRAYEGEVSVVAFNYEKTRIAVPSSKLF